MANELKVSVGQHSDRGRKPVNQDFHGVLVPNEPLLSSKGIAIALADAAPCPVAFVALTVHEYDVPLTSGETTMGGMVPLLLTPPQVTV